MSAYSVQIHFRVFLSFSALVPHNTLDSVSVAYLDVL